METSTSAQTQEGPTLSTCQTQRGKSFVETWPTVDGAFSTGLQAQMEICIAHTLDKSIFFMFLRDISLKIKTYVCVQKM